MFSSPSTSDYSGLFNNPLPFTYDPGFPSFSNSLIGGGSSGGNNLSKYIEALGALGGTARGIRNIVDSFGGQEKPDLSRFEFEAPNFDDLVNSDEIRDLAKDIKKESKEENINVLRAVLNDLNYLTGTTGAERVAERERGFNQYYGSAVNRFANALENFQPTGLNKGAAARDIGNIYNAFSGFSPNRAIYNEARNPSSVKADISRLGQVANAAFNPALFALSDYTDAASQAMIAGKPLYSRATADFYGSDPVQSLLNMNTLSNTGQSAAEQYQTNQQIKNLINYGGGNNQFQQDIADFYTKGGGENRFSDFRDPRAGSLMETVAGLAAPLSFTKGRSDFYDQEFFQNPGSFNTKRSGYFGTGDLTQATKLNDPFTFSSGRPDLDDSAILADLGDPYTFSDGRSPIFTSAGFDNPNTFASGRSDYISNDPDMRRPFRFSNSRIPYRG